MSVFLSALRSQQIIAWLIIGILLGFMVNAQFVSQAEEVPEISGIVYSSDESAPCLSDYQDWDSSGTFKSGVSWETYNIIGQQNNGGGSIPVNQFLEINGDGLVDHVYYYNRISDNKAYVDACTMLNTGSGWEIVYKCVTTAQDGVFTYYGDCADTSS